eukprot:1183356-Prorocentrum_minimum.AAC.3
MASKSAQPMNKLTPADVVMRSLISGQQALDNGDAEHALKILKSVDELCKKAEAPPTVHGLNLRCGNESENVSYLHPQFPWVRSARIERTTHMDSCVEMLGDAYMAMGQFDESRETLNRGIGMNEAAEKNPQLPEFLLKDVQGRLADLYAAMGELERKSDNWKSALR